MSCRYDKGLSDGKICCLLGQNSVAGTVYSPAMNFSIMLENFIRNYCAIVLEFNSGIAVYTIR